MSYGVAGRSDGLTKGVDPNKRFRAVVFVLFDSEATAV
jgi:hypothetical protein